MTDELSVSDVARLIDDPSAANRANAAGKVASRYEDGALSDTERQIAEDIFRVMVKDAEERVRTALVTHLKHAPELSSDVAVVLAKDASDAVAVPMLEFSEALSDEDLIDIVRTQGSQRQTAVASRPTVSPAVSDVIVDHGDETAVATLVGNEGAEVADSTMHKVVDRFGDSEKVQTPLVMRSSLPIAVSERLVAKVSDKLIDRLVTHHELPGGLADDLVLQIRERATLGLLSADSNDSDVEMLVEALVRNRRLTPSILLRAICVGDLSFFEAALAKMAGISVLNARKLVHDKGALGFKSLYERCQLPASLYHAYRIALDVLQETERERIDGDPNASTRRMLERVLTQFEDLVDDESPEDVDFLLNRLGRAANAA
ncbi:MAG: DUF2336 domain-containing protein [Rhodospirillaceae bacterium]|nr:DUF2336 domain-containing protein [Rhodospirillaceae bacterium]MDD9914866.1 DUF2336 domain-containing protein [Rhodospirillaceae bacterium]MDD9927217.1 DUF2336 domain-containing protein [Rhodospirillaceae bacterium]